MKRSTFFWTLAALLLLVVVQGVAAAEVSYYNFNDNIADKWNTSNGTWVAGALYNTSYPVYGTAGNGSTKSGDFNGSNYMSFNGVTPLTTSSVAYWINLKAVVGSDGTYPVEMGANPASNIWNSISLYINRSIYLAYNGGSWSNDYTGQYLQLNSWEHVIVVVSPTQKKLYLNGTKVYEKNYTTNTPATGGNANWVGIDHGGHYTKALVDDLKVFSHALNDTEALNLFNCGNETTCSGAPANTTTTYQVSVNDSFDDSLLSGVNVTFYNASGYLNSSLTNATGGAIYSLTGVAAPASVSFNATLADYAGASAVSVAANASASANIVQAVYHNLTVSSLITNATVTPSFTLSVQGGKNYTLTGAATNIYLRAGQMNFTWSKSGWYSLSFSQNVTALTNATTMTATGAYNAQLNVTAKDVLLNTTINTFNLTSENDTYSYNVTTATTTGGTAIPLLQGLNYFLFIDAPGYGLANTTLAVANTTPAYQFTLYTANSVYVNIFDEDTSAPIYQNITVVVTGTNFSQTNSTTTSHFFIDNLVDGNYTFKLSGANYTLKSYTVTVGGRSTQTLNTYLSASTAQTIFTYQDESSGETLEGIGVTMYRLINSTWTVVESKTSDITGRVQFTYTVGVKYKFYSTLAGYDDKIFYLDPVLFSTYIVKMSRQVSLSDAGSLIGVAIIYSPQSFASNDTANFSFLITSPVGALITYGLNLTYPGTSAQYTGTNANGGQFTHTYNLSGALGSDTFVVRYWYNSTLSGYQNFTAIYRIKGIYSTTSIEALKDNRFGLGVFETVFVSIIITGIVAGVAAMIAGPLVGGGLGLILLSFFVYIGFVPIWAAVISFLIGFVLIVKRGD